MIIVPVFGVVIHAAMLPVTNIHLKDIYESTVEFFAIRSPSFYFRGFTATDDSEPDPENRALTPVPDPIARLTRECANLREKLDTADRRQRHSTCPCRSTSTVGATLPSMRRELDVTKNELARSQTEVVRLEERYKMLEKTLRETKEMLKARDQEVERLKKERPVMDRRRSDGDQKQQLQGLVAMKTKEDIQNHSQTQKPEATDCHIMNGTQNEWRGGDGAVQVMAPIEEERAQVQSLDTFLTKVDRWSGAQVIQAVQDLNSETLQFAASVTEVCTFDRHPGSSPARITQATHDTTSRLGQHLSRILSTRDHAQDPILVQLALQGCISTCISRALSTFCMGFQPKSDVVLSQIYSQMYLSGTSGFYDYDAE